MLPKNNRIKRSAFSLLLKGAKVFKNNLFLMRFVSTDKSGSQFSFSVSKKISKSAVVRNRLRRTGYRLIAKHIERIKPNILVSFSFRELPKDEEYVEKNLTNILIESKLIK